MLLREYLFVSFLLIIMLCHVTVAHAASVEQICKTGQNFENALEELLNGNEEKAKEELEKETTNNPKSPLGYILLANYYTDQVTGGSMFTSSQLKPDDCLLEANTKARELYKQAILVDPECKEAYLGFWHTSFSRFDKMDKNTQSLVLKAMEIMPNFFLEKVPRYFTTGIPEAPEIEKEISVFEETGDYFFNNGLLEDAIKYYELMILSIGAGHRSAVKLADCYRIMGDLELQTDRKKKYYKASKYYLTIKKRSINMDEPNDPKRKVKEIEIKLSLLSNKKEDLLKQIKCYEAIADKLIQAKEQLLTEAIANYEKALSLIEKNSLDSNIAIPLCTKIKDTCSVIINWYKKNADVFDAEDFPKKEVEKYTDKQKKHEEKLSSFK